MTTFDRINAKLDQGGRQIQHLAPIQTARARRRFNYWYHYQQRWSLKLLDWCAKHRDA